MSKWSAWRDRQIELARTDSRVQAIRCSSCNRLRHHPVKDDPRTWNCNCGSMQFVLSYPHPDEEQLAIKLYYREIEERNAWKNVVP